MGLDGAEEQDGLPVCCPEDLFGGRGDDHSENGNEEDRQRARPHLVKRRCLGSFRAYVTVAPAVSLKITEKVTSPGDMSTY